ncbi:unnamed protein product [Toxocara canis]|uniref:Uncharacterized protein n=2 Tax=Toxocara canis TaxID=6265 RepID=A0A183UAD4_TOXCA|nr:unnamed protein product [Toxocara canis]
MLFGDDYEWYSKIALENFGLDKFKVYASLPLNATAAIVFAFARRHCDSVLLTASASTFGWWMAYLAKETATIYYNRYFSYPKGIVLQLNPSDFFPSNWTALALNAKGDGVTVF